MELQSGVWDKYDNLLLMFPDVRDQLEALGHHPCKSASQGTEQGGAGWKVHLKGQQISQPRTQLLKGAAGLLQWGWARGGRRGTK